MLVDGGKMVVGPAVEIDIEGATVVVVDVVVVVEGGKMVVGPAVVNKVVGAEVVEVE